MTTEIQRAASILESKRYAIGIMYDGPEYSLITFYDRATLRPEWNGRDVVGKVFFRAGEIVKARREGGSKALVHHRVREAELRLLDEIGETKIKETEALKKLAVNLSLTLLAVYPLIGWIF